VSDAKNKGTCETGAQWLKNHRRYYDNNKKAYVESNDIKEEKRNNDPFSIQIINLEHRGNGGRAYKVVTENGYYVDLREDVLLDVIKQSTVNHGRPGCQFIWGKVNAEMKLVRTGSELHDALLLASEVGSTKVIKSRDLVPGHLYQSKGGEKQIFIGWVDYEILKEQAGRYYDQPRIAASLEPVKKEMLFLNVASAHNRMEEGENLFLKVLNDPHFNPYCLELRTTHSFRLDIGQFNIGEDPCTTIRNLLIRYCQQQPLTRTYGYKAFGNTDEEKLKNYVRQEACRWYKLLTIRPTGKAKPTIPPVMDLAVGQRVG
jgi:hypothetical protein